MTNAQKKQAAHYRGLAKRLRREFPHLSRWDSNELADLVCWGLMTEKRLIELIATDAEELHIMRHSA